MSEPGDRVDRAYRSLAREEPPASLDAAVLAAAQRAVARPSLARRWGVPVSVAALLVLALGVTLEMQHEEPGVELSAPGERAGASAPASPAVQPEPQVQAKAKPRPQSQAGEKPQARSQPKERVQTRADLMLETPAKRPETKPQAEAPALREEARRKDATEANAPAAAAAPSPRELPRPFAAAPAPAQPHGNAATPGYVPQAAPPARDLSARARAPSAPEPAASGAVVATPPASEARLAAPAANMAKRSAAAGATADTMAADPHAALEKIAKLRAQGRDAEADRALEEFRKRFPDYRIDDAMWERVKPP